jgi:hypothetical protein
MLAKPLNKPGDVLLCFFFVGFKPGFIYEGANIDN